MHFHTEKDDEIVIPYQFTESFQLLASKTKIQNVSITSLFDLQFDDFVMIIKRIWPNVKVNMNILNGFEQDLRNDYTVPTSFESWNTSGETNEIQMLKTLKTLPNIKRFRCNLRSDQNPKDVIKEIQRLQLNKVSLEELVLGDIQKLHGETPSLSIFRNLKKLTLHKYKDHNRGDNLVTDNCDKFKFIQKLYSNNCKTLKDLTIFVQTEALMLLPSEHINLVLQHITLASYKEEHDKFVQVFVNQQLANLKSICITDTKIDSEMISVLARTEHLEKLSILSGSILNLETIFPDFFILKTLDLSWSSLTYTSLQLILENNKLQNTLESLSLENSEILGQNLTSKLTKLNFPKLSKLNLLLFDDDIALLNDFHFHAPQLEQLKFNSRDSGLFLEQLLKYPELKVLSLGHLKDANDVHSTLTRNNNLEVVEFIVDVDLLTTVMGYLDQYGKDIKFARIAFRGSKSEGLESLRLSYINGDYRDYNFWHDELNVEFVKFSNMSRTIIFHPTSDEEFPLDGLIYEEFLTKLWE